MQTISFSRLPGVTARFGFCRSTAYNRVSDKLLTAPVPLGGRAVGWPDHELDAIAATVIGGTSLMGGQGSVVGTLIGALIMGVLRNGLNLLGVSSFVQQVVIGTVIIAAVLLDTLFKQPKR